ncbi:hypothetical protein HJG54_04005 [Leptolyngbya sp. NK1-12]|uniref:Uncharacterized protein n=1 Tax=Leptolyngbya sp. NK1-12 TaxID=2547451 RepID=A0AA96WBM9_9CYAN|nr:hypothetical protein [Leptolyngbya sp. NK1-12]WNZ22114.1 hypothetical protein HJG54_04005 [Leptolyngbya sp. NK1-12]
MIHHISFAVNNPLHVAEVIAELWQGRAIPFPGHPGSFVTLSFDSYGTAIEFLPKDTVLKPGSQNKDSVWFDASHPNAIGYTASHVNIAVPISEAEIYAIADREGWRAVRCSRQGFFDLIEFWIENEVLIELLPPNLIEQYLHLVQPENLKAALNLDLSSENTLLAN